MNRYRDLDEYQYLSAVARREGEADCCRLCDVADADKQGYCAGCLAALRTATEADCQEDSDVAYHVAWLRRAIA